MQYTRGDIIIHKYHKYPNYYYVEASKEDKILIKSGDWTTLSKYFDLITDIFNDT